MGIQVPGFGVSKSSGGLDLNGYAGWQHPHTNARIYMSPEVLQTVCSCAVQALRATPSTEVSGLVWGRILSNGSERSLLLASAQFINSEESHYNSTDANTFRLIEAIHGPKPRADLWVVGYFRSDAREDLQLSERDKFQHGFGQLTVPVSEFDTVQPLSYIQSTPHRFANT